MKRLFKWLVDRWKVTVPIAVISGAIGAWLFFGVFGFHLIFVDEKVDEAAPVFVAATSAPETPSDTLGAEPAGAATEQTTEEDIPAIDEAEEPEESTVEAVAVPATILSGAFIDRSHPTLGTAAVITDGSEQRFLRFEDFQTDNGPDLDVYLVAADPDAPVGELGADFVNLGDLKGNVGSQNYEIPPEVDLERYRTVVIWCVRFAVAFGAAPLA